MHKSNTNMQKAYVGIQKCLDANTGVYLVTNIRYACLHNMISLFRAQNVSLVASQYLRLSTV
jgi:hypothetical protein